MTYLTKEDWSNYFVPKISDDKSFSDHIKQNIIIQNAFIRLISIILTSQKNSEKKLSQKILISSMIYIHKYILFNNISLADLSSLDKLILYSACIFIAFKEANKLIDINMLSSKFQPYFNKFKIYDISEIKDLIIQKEFDILISIEFNMAVDWPYGILNLLKIYLKKLEKGIDSIIKVINYVNLNINDSILFPLCLYYTPNEIVFSCILLAKKEHNLDFININDLIKLNKCNINNDNLKECAILISKIIKNKNYLIDNKKIINNNSNTNNIKCENNNYLQNDKDNLNIKKIALIQTNDN